MAAEELAANQFQIKYIHVNYVDLLAEPVIGFLSAGDQSYILAAVDAEKAHSWIRKLQDKREQWIHRYAARGKTDLDRQAKKKVFQPLHERPGVVLPDAGQCDA